ncbi:hypothetical protein ACMD2_01536 [Ananas comosus]|uniref:Uncharacterized protein n=1 Tax=Ananas comosus TaxID=4615 RepID=A0A199W1D8_ANACO|nr:hypothetical protein ACMD2_01536 [Ananas comosus]
MTTGYTQLPYMPCSRWRVDGLGAALVKSGDDVEGRALSFLVRLMLSDEISITEVTKLKAVKAGGGPPLGILGGSGMALRDQTGTTDGSGRPLAISPTAFMNWATPWPSNTRWLKQMPTAIPPHLNTVT